MTHHLAHVTHSFVETQLRFNLYFLEKMTDYRGGGMTNMKIRAAEKLVETIRGEVEEKRKLIQEKVCSKT